MRSPFARTASSLHLFVPMAFTIAAGVACGGSDSSGGGPGTSSSTTGAAQGGGGAVAGSGAATSTGTAGSGGSGNLGGGGGNAGSGGGGGSGAGCGGLTDCAGNCVDTTTDNANCGTCGTACSADQHCAASYCVCNSGVPCGAACVDTQNDNANCGGCNIACLSNQQCASGSCACACSPGLSCCGPACVDLLTDPMNCGACGNVCATSCQSGACACGSASVSFAAAVQPIFTANCTGCHAGASPPKGLSLEAGQSYSLLVGVMAQECTDGRIRVVPGDPANSYLLDKLTGLDMCFGVQMPKGNPPLAGADIQTITDWICEGAPNN